MKFYKNKKILITGGTGLIGIQLTNLLLNFGAKVTVVSLEKNHELSKKVKFFKSDLRILGNCLKVTKNQEFVFHLAGIKGSPKLTMTRPYSFMTPMILFNTNMLEACRMNKVKRYLYTSSIGVYNPRSIMKESDVWKTYPSKNDWYSGWAKRLGELQVDALAKEENKKMKTVIVRPANVYGPHDNFDVKTAMVIPSLINKFVNSKDKSVEVWGDGSPIRDFIFSKDVAISMAKLMKLAPKEPVNIGSGNGYKIKYVVDIINKFFKNQFKIKWDKSKPSGDKIRILDTKYLNSLGIKQKTPLEKGIIETIKWYFDNKNKQNRFNIFK
jgi:GDP-L-fucose synthase